MKTKNKTIWKYELKPIDMNVLEVPKGAMILSAQPQNGVICLWMLLDPETEKEQRRFGLIMTGHYIKAESGNYIATIQADTMFGGMVYHLFEF